MKIGKKYVIVIDGCERTLTYTCNIIDQDETYIKIQDKNGVVINISKNKIISFREI